MTKRQIYTAALAIILLSFLRAVPALAHGDKIVPHVVNGLLGGQKYRTKFDITNLGVYSSTPITNVKVIFRQADGNPWLVETDQGTGPEIRLNLGASQTIRITTSGNGDYVHGYAIVRNLENAGYYAEDYEVAITVYYEVLSGSNIIETVSVPVGQQTVRWVFPVEIDTSKNLGTGFAIVDLSGAQNPISLELYREIPETLFDPILNDYKSVPDYSANLTLAANQKQARMLTEGTLFPFPDPKDIKFKGVLVGKSQGPVAILGLLVTPVPTNAFQYATMAPAYLDSMRRNTLMYLPQGFSLDADLLVSDYLHSEIDSFDEKLEIPWDLLYQTGNDAPPGGQSTGALRYLVPQPGATFSIIGVFKDEGTYQGAHFDGITQSYLSGLTYTSDAIDLSEGASKNYLQVGFIFAIKTGLGRYVKVRVRDYVGYSNSNYIDLMLEIFVYK
jgi:hypothetical protein